MAELNPSIILDAAQINDPNAMADLKLKMQKVTQGEQQLKGQNALRQILGNPQSYVNGQLSPQAKQAVFAADPETGIEFQKQDYAAQVEKAKAAAAQTEAGTKKFDFMSGLAGIGVNAHDEAIKAGKSEPEARAAAVEARNSAAEEAHKTGSGLISDEELAGITSQPFDPIKATALAMADKEFATSYHQRQTEANADKRLDEQMRRDDASIAREEALIAKGDKPTSDKFGEPGEVEFTDKSGAKKTVDAVYDKSSGTYLTAEGHKPIDGDEFRPLKGGEAGLGNRAEVFLKRTETAANEAVQAAKNISELPITTSRGVFGGREQGPGLFDASKESLVNSLTTQEVQDYNTMIAGVQRNLSSIEAGGLAPSGSLTNSMSAVVLKYGDSNLTKMRKMAELRQIVEKGMEPNLSDPKIPTEQKDFIKKIIGDMQNAVPFTQHDLTLYERNGKPGESISAYVGKTVNQGQKFDTEADAMKAYDDGKIKIGDTIMINGKPHKVGE